MARRQLDTSFWDDQEVAALGVHERLLLICMITDDSLRDHCGRLTANPGILRKHAFGYDEDVSIVNVAAWRDGIEKACRNIHWYSLNGQDYIDIKGFVAALYKNPRGTYEYRTWRKAVLERDDYTCQRCDWGCCDPSKLHAHHIAPWAEFQRLRFSVDNGVTLCAECHKALHRETRANAQ